jgi:hypothetical protein
MRLLLALLAACGSSPPAPGPAVQAPVDAAPDNPERLSIRNLLVAGALDADQVGTRLAGATPALRTCFTTTDALEIRVLITTDGDVGIVRGADGEIDDPRIACVSTALGRRQTFPGHRPTFVYALLVFEEAGKPIATPPAPPDLAAEVELLCEVDRHSGAVDLPEERRWDTVWVWALKKLRHPRIGLFMDTIDDAVWEIDARWKAFAEEAGVTRTCPWWR